jgi:hypothetical protein
MGLFFWFLCGAIGFFPITRAWVHDFGDMNLGIAILWGIGSLIFGPCMLAFGAMMYVVTFGLPMPFRFLKITVIRQNKEKNGRNKSFE